MQYVPKTKQALQSSGVTTNTDIWLRQMSERDTQLWGMTKPLWVIDNKVYDFSDFASHHPGGSSWILHTRGQDISVMVRTHHLEYEKVAAIICKYYVGQASIKNEPRFFMDGHFQTIRQLILQQFKVQQLHNMSSTKIRCYLLITLWLVLFSLTGYYKSYVLAIICGYFLMIFYAIGHLFIHRKDTNILRHALLFIGFSAEQQQILHAISHHPYANTLLDYQIRGLQPIISYTRCLPPNRWYSFILTQVLLMTLSPSNIITKMIIVPILKKTRPSFQQSLMLLQIVYLYIFTSSIVQAVKLWLVMVFMFGFCFGKMLACLHRQPQLWTQGSPEIRDYVVHMIATTADTTHKQMPWWKSLILYSGFNIHALHHLFPTIDHSQLPKCNKIFVEYCRNNGLKLIVNDLVKCNRKILQLELSLKASQFDIRKFVTQ